MNTVQGGGPAIRPAGRILFVGSSRPSPGDSVRPGTGRRSRRARLSSVVIAAVIVLPVAAAPGAPAMAMGRAALPYAANHWVPTARMAAPRANATATMLPNGQVLVAGGGKGCNPVCVGLSSAELYNPSTATWSPTGSMTFARQNHTATLLPNGQVLVAGGQSTNFRGVTSAELYNPSTGTWTVTGSLSAVREYFAATLLPGGQVLVEGGYGGHGQAVASAELYDPSAGTWTPTGSMAMARQVQTATLLPTGKVLIAGGWNQGVSIASAELYDPASGTWTPTGSMTAARAGHTATRLPNGTVLVAGGSGSQSGNPVGLDSAEVYDPASGTWTSVTNMHNIHSEHTATLLRSGGVLVAGGGPPTAEVYDPSTGTWTYTAPMSSTRSYAVAALLPNGSVLVAGGFKNCCYSVALASAEVYTP